MATPDQIPTDLTLDLGDNLSPEDFLFAVRHFTGFVDEITAAQEGDGSDVKWTVKVRQGSNLIGFEPATSAPRSRLSMIYNAAFFAPNAVANGNLDNAGLSEKAVEHIKALSYLASKNVESHVNIWVRREVVQIRPEIAQIAADDAASSYYDWGTVEGRLEAIQDASGSLKIRVKDFMFPRAITCRVPETLIEMVMIGFRRRVEIEGRIHFRSDGSPISIEAESIELIPEDDELPTADQVKGLLAPA